MISTRYFCLILTKFLDDFTVLFKSPISDFTEIRSVGAALNFTLLFLSRVGLLGGDESSDSECCPPGEIVLENSMFRLPWWAAWSFCFRWWREILSRDSTIGNWTLVVQPVATHFTPRAPSVIPINRTPDIPVPCWATLAHTEEIKRLAKPTS